MRRMMVFRLSLTGLLLLGGRDARAEDGATALLAEDYPKAIELERATARDSRDPAQVADAYLRLADMALDAGDTKGALAAASSCAAIQASPILQQCELREADILRLRGDLERARSLAAVATKSANATGFGQLQRVMAEISLAAGQLDKASEFAKASVAAQAASELEEADRQITLGRVLAARGEWQAAHAALERGLDLQRAVFGWTHPRLALARVELADVQRVLGETTLAEQNLLNAADALSAELGRNVPSLAPIYAELSALHEDAGEHAVAETFAKASLALGQGLGPMLQAQFATRLAAAELGLGNASRAGEPLHAASRSWETLVAPHSAALETALREAQLALAEGDLARASKLGQNVLGVHESRADALGIAASERLLAVAEPAQRVEHLKHAISVIEKSFPSHPLLGALVHELGLALASAGQVDEAASALRRALFLHEKVLRELEAHSSSEAVAAFLDARSRETDELVASAVKGGAVEPWLALEAVTLRKGRELEGVSRAVDLLRRRAQDSDQRTLQALALRRAELASLDIQGPEAGATVDQYAARVHELRQMVTGSESKLSALAGDGAQGVGLSLREVAQALPEAAVLLEYVRYRSGVAGTGGTPSSALAGQSTERYALFTLTPAGRVTVYDLGPVSVLDAEVEKLRNSLSDPSTDPRPVAAQLYEVLLGPASQLLQGIEFVFVAPAASLNLVPFAALVNGDGRYAVEEHTWVELTSGRDLLRLRDTTPPREGPVIVAAPDFGERGNPTGATILARAHFDALPGTESEAQALHGLLPNARVLTHAAASEDALRGLRAPQILHVATHGFFLAAKPSVVNARTRGLELLPASNVPAEWTIDEPMLRSGLAFSGANQHHRGSNDGILTALEALSLDLTGTELVVLSACETGVGEATGGEGVYGLRRALLIAGAQTQVMSLWKIDDETTSRLMQGYYRAVVDGRGRAEALRDVQLSLARDSKYRHPYYWASFIVSGNPASLHGRSAGQVPTAQPGARGCACDLVGARSFRATSGHWLVGTLAALTALLLWRRQRAESRRGLSPAVSVLAGVTLLGACAASVNPPPTMPHARQIALPSAPASAYLEAQEACTRGDAVQCYLLGLDEQTSGEDIANPGPEELARARPHFERGCALGDAASCGALAQYFSRCWQGCKDAEQRREEFTWYLYMERACDLGDPAPCAELGRLWHDEGFLRKAQLYFQRGCEAGGITSQQACEALNEQR